MKNHKKTSAEWHKQADYDLVNAEVLFKNGLYVYTIFFCHLAVEKSLKGLYVKIMDQNPPRTHILTFLLSKLNLEVPQHLSAFFERMNHISAPIRYPKDLQDLVKQYRKGETRKILDQSRELIEWIKEK